jgi:hypothetical protein
LSVVVNCVLLWVGMLLLTAPRTDQQVHALAGLGSVVLLSGPTDMLLGLGQVTPWAVLGLGLILRWPQGWVGAFGLSVVLFLPQVGVVLTLVLLALRRGQLVIRGWLVMLLLSLPALVPSVLASGGVSDLVASSVASLSRLASEANADNRIDIGGNLASTSLPEWVLPLVAVTACVILVAALKPQLDVVLLLGVTSLSATVLYHMPYHLPLEMSLAAAVLATRAGTGSLRFLCAALLAIGASTTYWLLPRLEANAPDLLMLLTLGFSLVPATLAVVALGGALASARATISSARVPDSSGPATQPTRP